MRNLIIYFCCIIRTQSFWAEKSINSASYTQIIMALEEMFNLVDKF